MAFQHSCVAVKSVSERVLCHFPSKKLHRSTFHMTRALHFHWTKQTHRTADVVIFCLFQETKKKNVDLFWRLAIFSKLFVVFSSSFEASQKQTNFFFFFNLKTAKFPSLPPSPSQSVVKLRHRREEEEEADMEHVFNFWILFFSKQCCESYELWFCPYFVVHMWGNFAKCENILTSATPRPVRC